MFIRTLATCEEIIAGDGTQLRELLHATKDNLPLGYSLAHARLEPGKTSDLHRLVSSEVYYILAGEGRMEIDGEQCAVTAGDAIHIPPHAAQRITAAGPAALEFLCIVDPAWRPEDEVILTDPNSRSKR